MSRAFEIGVGADHKMVQSSILDIANLSSCCHEKEAMKDGSNTAFYAFRKMQTTEPRTAPGTYVSHNNC